MSSMNRSMRRAYLRRNKGLTAKEFEQKLQAAAGRIDLHLSQQQKERQVSEDSMHGAMIMWACIGVALNHVYGWKAHGVLRVYEEIDRMMQNWSDGDDTTEGTLKKLQRELRDEVGIELDPKNLAVTGKI